MAGTSTVLNAAGLGRPFKKHAIKRILIYHYIDNNSVKSFERQIAYYSKNFRMLSLSEFIKTLDTRTVANDNILSITFDDAYRNIYQNAASVLDRYNIKPCIFVPTGFVETPNKIEYVKKNIKSNLIDDPISWEQLKDLRDKGYEIGSHGWAHLDFGKGDVDYELEFLKSKTILQNRLECEVEYFAFPFGRRSNITQTALDSAKEYGYSRTFSGIRCNTVNNNFLLPRTCINPSWSLKVVKCILAGYFDNQMR